MRTPMMSHPIYDDLCYRMNFYPHDRLWMAMFRHKWHDYYLRSSPDYRDQFISKGY